MPVVFVFAPVLNTKGWAAFFPTSGRRTLLVAAYLIFIGAKPSPFNFLSALSLVSAGGNQRQRHELECDETFAQVG
jgi:hypothetical protein